MSVKGNEHFKNRLTIWLCTKMLRLRLVPSLWCLRTFFQIVNFTGNGRPGNRWANLFSTSCNCYLFDTIQSQWKLSALLWATSWSVLAVQICFSTLVNANFKGFGTMSIVSLLLKCSLLSFYYTCCINWCDRTYFSWYRWKEEIAL